MLTLPDGTVTAFEIDEKLAALAKENLEPFENVDLVCGNAASSPLPSSDLIYVNAGVVEPPVHWLEALNPGGRLIVPLCPVHRAGVAMLITRKKNGFEAKPFMPVWFIPCIGASEMVTGSIEPGMSKAWNARSIHEIETRAPDQTALITGHKIWFSSEPIER